MTCPYSLVQIKVIFAFIFSNIAPVSEGHGHLGGCKSLAKQKDIFIFPSELLPARLGNPPEVFSHGFPQRKKN